MSTYTEKAKVLRASIDRASEHLSDEQALESKELYPPWKDLLGKILLKDKRFRYEDGLFKCEQEHVPAEHYPPSAHTAALYSRVTSGGPEVWQSGQVYDKDVEVVHNNWVWLSMVPHNHYEPGAPGVYDNVWKKVRSA